MARLLERATFGPGPADREALGAWSPEAWVEDQLARGTRPDVDLIVRLAGFPMLEASPREALGDMDLPRMDEASRDPERAVAVGRRALGVSAEVAGARLVRAVHGRAGLREVMIDFWSNHFSVFGAKKLVGAALPHYQREVLEPHALGRFEDLLVASAESPAMLLYLDAWSSTAPQGRLVRRMMRGRGGINENYARELLELHTLGVDGGYDQADVEAVARAFTGWTLESRREPEFRFRERLHDPGPKTVLGRRLRGEGIEEGYEILRRLARHPSTARHLAHKLVARFVAARPPANLVVRTARRFLETEGDIPSVLATVLTALELAHPEHRKLKTPVRLFASAVRATGGETDGGRGTLRAVGRLGELPFFARSPAGFPEDADHWIEPGALLERMSLAFALADDAVPGTRLGEAQPPGPRPAGLSSREARAVALAAPEFQWT